MEYHTRKRVPREISGKTKGEKEIQLGAYIPADLGARFDKWLSERGRGKKRVIAALVHLALGMSAEEMDQLIAGKKPGSHKR